MGQTKTIPITGDGKAVWRLPPLILHPFAANEGPDLLLDGSRAQLILHGLLPAEGVDPDELRRVVLADRYYEIRMLFYLGKDLLRWAEQCVDFTKREAALHDLGIREQSFSALLVETPPALLSSKLSEWGIKDQRGVFSRALGLNVIFAEPPAMEDLSVTFIQSYQRFADYLFICYQNLCPFTPIEPARFSFDMYASDEYAKMLAEGWESAGV